MTEPKSFSISRDLKAPRALVYEVQTEAKHLAKWLSPEGFKTIHSAMDFRVGGKYHYGLEGPDGTQIWGLQRFREIAPNEKIVLIQSFSDKDGGLARHPMSPDWPLEMLSTTTFEDIGAGMTRLTINWRPYNSDEAGIQAFEAGRPSMTGGFGGVFKKLEAYLAELQGV
ncbi:MAG TPA: SRPBCC domain-containing protein [Roseiarcus sp.]